MTYRNTAIALAAVAMLLASCVKEEPVQQPEELMEVPDHFPPLVYESKTFPVSKERIELGRELFYERRLSSNNTISCGDCHAQVHAFADHNTPVSFGVNGAMGVRNSPALINLAWQTSFMHDGGVNHLEMVALVPIMSEIEMNQPLDQLIVKLNDDEYYLDRFKKAFGRDSIDSQQLLIALAQFQMTLVSADSRYDQYMEGRARFTEQEERGLDLFMTNCSSCHQPPLFTDYSFSNNGLDSVYSDRGRELITLNPEDRGKFKVPTLRNIDFTYPYMHDGRWYNLIDVLNHYTDGIQDNPQLDQRLSEPIVLSDEEKRDVIAFLKTLNDYGFISNHKFSEP
jgi:cytochrome c peroxidase